MEQAVMTMCVVTRGSGDGMEYKLCSSGAQSVWRWSSDKGIGDRFRTVISDPGKPGKLSITASDTVKEAYVKLKLHCSIKDWVTEKRKQAREKGEDWREEEELEIQYRTEGEFFRAAGDKEAMLRSDLIGSYSENWRAASSLCTDNGDSQG